MVRTSLAGTTWGPQEFKSVPELLHLPVASLDSQKDVGCRALLVHAESIDARDFYRHFREFEDSPSDPLTSYLLMKDIRRTPTR